MPLNYPVEVSYHEASAYCKWKGPNFRLIKESEFNVIRGEEINSEYTEDMGAFDREVGNTHLKFGGSTPVDYYNASTLGFHDCYGNVWEWSQDWYRSLPGFKQMSLYPDYSAPCFDHAHSTILGGSWASTGSISSTYAKFGFRRHFYQNVGFRLVEDIPDND